MWRAALLVVTLTCLGGPLAASADESDVGRRYNGSSLAAGILGGAELLADPYPGRLGYAVGAFARFNTVMTVFAAQLQYEFARHALLVDDASVDAKRHGLSLALHYHPLFLRLLTNNTLWYTLSAWYVEVGAGLDVTSLRGTALGLDRTRAAGALHTGSGIELPLGEADDEGAFWVGIGWRWRFPLLEVSLGRHDDLHAHLVDLWIAYRWNNTSFARVPRPPELRWR